MNNHKYCQKCGAENEINNAFCIKCGNPFENNNVNTENNDNNTNNNTDNTKENNVQQNNDIKINPSSDIKYEIKGGNLPFLVLNLSKGQQIVCESGSMSWRTDNVTMATSSNGGVGKVFSRMFSGESLFQNVYTAESDNASIAFASSFPGAIKAIDIEPGKDVICQKTSFLAGTAGVEVSIHFNKKIGVGLFAGEGFIMQRMSGHGKVFIEIDGSIEEKYLQAGEKLIISTGHLVMMDATCSIDVETVKGLKNVFLGGEGLFNTIITGPGKVVMQSMPVSKTATTLYAYMPIPSSSSTTSSVIDLFNKK